MMRFVSIFIVSLVLTCVKCQLSCGDNQFACFDGKKVGIIYTLVHDSEVERP